VSGNPTIRKAHSNIGAELSITSAHHTRQSAILLMALLEEHTVEVFSQDLERLFLGTKRT
jgi:hypothetical protein